MSDYHEPCVHCGKIAPVRPDLKVGYTITHLINGTVLTYDLYVCSKECKDEYFKQFFFAGAIRHLCPCVSPPTRRIPMPLAGPRSIRGRGVRA